MDDEELEQLLRDMVDAAVRQADAVTIIADVIRQNLGDDDDIGE